MICDSPAEIYHNAIPFSPSSSWLHEYYSPELLKRVKVVYGLQAEWGRCSRTVSLDCLSSPLACWKNILAACSKSHDIIIFDAITGTPMSILYGHTEYVKCLTFSLDGTFLASGSHDRTVKLWDIQTGGVVKTFCGHTGPVVSTSISPDCTIMASGSLDCRICLWNTWSGQCYHVICEHSDIVQSVSFSPTNSQLLISASNDHTVRQWDISGHQIGPSYKGDHAVVSPDGLCFVSWSVSGKVVTVQNFDSGIVVAELQAPTDGFELCCFSPDGRFLAGSTPHTICIWDFTGSDYCLIETFTEHNYIYSIAFSSSHLFSCSNGLIKFWPVCTLPMNSLTTDLESIQPTPALITSINLQGKDGVATLADSTGMVKVWDLSTGLCKSLFHTKAGPNSLRDMWLIDGRLIFVWCTNKKIRIWDSGRKMHLQTMDAKSNFSTTTMRISSDGSKVFLCDHEYIQALSTWTGEVMGKVKFESKPSNKPLIVDGSRVWVCFEGSKTQGWDFGVPGLVPIPLYNMPPDPDRPRLDFIDGTKGQNVGISRIEDTATGKVVCQLPAKYQEPTISQWDGRYLVAGYKSGEVLILDFYYIIP